MRFIFSGLAIVAVVAMLWSSLTPAYACTCGVPYPTPAEGLLPGKIAAAPLIAVGTVNELYIDPPYDPAATGIDYKVFARFGTEEYLKGAGPGDLDLLAYGLGVFENGEIHAKGAMCELVASDAAGRKFVFFFSGDNVLERDPWYCTGSRQLFGDQESEGYLRQIRAILSATPTPAPTSQTPNVTQTPTTSPLGFGDFGNDSRDHSSETSVVVGATLGLLGLAAGAFLYRRRLST